ncbi:LOG family protein [Candidatus Peregrinibacteria bacterium]|nr:LOG family protein [Candidatus Peregrinibacteria bacterium]
MPLRESPILISGGVLRDMGELSNHAELVRPSIEAVMQLAMPNSDFVRGAVYDNLKGDRIRKLHVIGRSGHSRVGLNIEMQEGITPEIGRNDIKIPILLSSLRGAKNDELLSNLKSLCETSVRPPEIGRMILADPEYSLNAQDIQRAKGGGFLYLSEGTEVADDGLISVPLEDLQYLFCEENFQFEEVQRKVLTIGKHAFDGLQSSVPYKTNEIKGGEFYVGAIKFALGNYMAVIENETNDPTTIHLAAKILDGMRTTGIHVPRQVEIYNRGTEPVNTNDLRIRIRIYPTPRHKRDKAEKFNIPAKIKSGIAFRDIAQLESGNGILTVLDGIEPKYREGGIYAKILAGDRMADIPWQKLSAFQHAHTLKIAERVVSEQPGFYVSDGDVDANLQWLTEGLNFVGGRQNEGKVLLSRAFPPADTMAELLKQDVAVFIANDLNIPTDAFPASCLPKDTVSELNIDVSRNDLNFTGTQYELFRNLERRGAKMHMIMHETFDESDDSEKIDKHIREFYRGFWVRPETKEAMEKVDTVIAFYGSHVDGLDNLLKEQLGSFIKRMKNLFGEGFAITHGKGPGVMNIADRIAEENDVYRLGVGIDLEQKDMQEANFKPPAIVDFRDTDRLPRQKIMDDISTFKIFNIGGAGTLEEAAISLCSQKLHKNITTPIIFVDPLGVNSGEHMWEKLHHLIEVLSDTHQISAKDAENGIENITLMQTYAKNFCHFVDSYDTAGDIIEEFVKDPAGYYKAVGVPKDKVEVSIQNAITTHKTTGFPMPKWFDKEKVMEGM